MDAARLEAEGWQRLPTRFFSAAIGPTWWKGRRGERIVGLLTSADCANDHMGTVHGGALMTFADIAMGCAVVDARADESCATVQLQFHFTASARVGSFITCQPEIVRQTSQLVFARGLFRVDDRTVGSADGIFKVLDAAMIERLKAG